jgi:acetate kinase
VSLLTINTGSSSLKAALYRMDGVEVHELSASLERVGLPGGHMRLTGTDGGSLLDEPRELPDHAAALEALLGWLQEQGYTQELQGVGHRVVHGGDRYSEPQLVDGELLAALRQLIPIDPMHLPQAIGAIEAVSRAFPAVPQVACFDTAFHRQMPRVAQVYPLPGWVEEQGVIRYGFHGLSYEYLLSELRRLDPVAADGRLILAHLGNGASMAAVRAGCSVETTMGFTPTGGLVMGTRSGDLDPGVLLYLLQKEEPSAEALNRLVNREAGLLGVSGVSADMHDLLKQEPADQRAALAVSLFCYQAKKFLGALAAVLGGLDTLVFTAGIGEHAAPVRERICSGLEFLGIEVDAALNRAHAPIISRGPVVVRVMHTDEDLMLARHTVRLVQAGTPAGADTRERVPGRPVPDQGADAHVHL